MTQVRRLSCIKAGKWTCRTAARRCTFKSSGSSWRSSRFDPQLQTDTWSHACRDQVSVHSGADLDAASHLGGQHSSKP